MDHFADVLAETGSIEEAARAVRVTVDVGRALFERICRALGPQAE
jgi:hypothetical protein